MATKHVPITPGAGANVAVQENAEGDLVQLVADLSAEERLNAIGVLLSAPLTVQDGGASLSVDDGGGSLTVDSEALGTKAEPEASGEGGIIGILKRLRTLWGAGLPGTLTASGNLKTAIVEALPAGTQEIGKVKATLEAGTAAIGKLAANAGVNIGSVGLLPQTTGGLEKTSFVSAASTNSTLAKASPGQVFGWYIFNKESVPIYLKLYNSATAPTVGTTAQFMVIGIPAGAGANVEFTNGIAFSTGIGLGITKGAASANAEAVAAEGVIVNLLWK